MPSASTPITAIDCLGRAIANLRANWELLPVYLAQQVAVTVLALLSVVVCVLPVWMALAPELGAADLDALLGIGDAELQRTLTDVLFALPDVLVPLAVGLLLGTLVGGAALLVSCWFYGGSFGILTAGDRRAPAGPPSGHRGFRVFSPGDFAAAANRLAWRYFWFVNLVLVYVLSAVLLWTVLLVLCVWVGERWGWAAAIGLGCLGSVPALAAVVGTTAWMWLGLAELARDDAGVRRAGRRAARLLKRRPAAVALVLALALAATLALSLGGAPVDLTSSLLFERALALWCGAQALIFAVQLAGSGVINLLMVGAFVALSNAETVAAA